MADCTRSTGTIASWFVAAFVSVALSCAAPLDDRERSASHDSELTTQAASLLMVVDDHYAASGYAADGATGGVVERDCPRRAGEQRGRCHAFTWTPGGAGWAGVFWQSPADNWGASNGFAIP